MDTFLKATGGVLIAAVICIVLAKRDKDISVILSIAVCTMVAAAAFSYLTPIISFLQKLQQLANMDPEILSILLKAVGIGILAEIACLICGDAGNAALGKILQFMAAIVILWISLPLFTSLMELLEDVLGGI